MVARSWFALLRKPDGLPCLFSSKSDAEENRDYDEYVVPVLVRPASLLDLARGERAVLEARREAKAKPPSSTVKVRGFGGKSRPRLPVEQKRRRGSALKVGGLGLLRAALKKSEKKFRKTVSEVVDQEARSASKAKAKKKKRGGRRAAASRARR